MEYNRLGQSELLISAVSMGCMSLKAGPKQATRVIHRALDLGINFFDTADLYEYGKNEAWLGRAIQEKRSEVHLATKVGNQWNDTGSSWVWNPSKAYILGAVETSLKRLKTDYIDLYQLHGGTLEDPVDETIEAFEILKEQGKIRAYGISSIRPNVIKAYAQRSNMVSVMMQYSLLDRRPEEGCLDLLTRHGISVITRGTLCKGLLAGKPATAYLGHAENMVEKASEAIQSVATKNGHSATLTACQYVMQSNVVASAVIGFRTIDQLENCIDGSKIGKLGISDYRVLQRSAPAHKYGNHRIE
jgi:aryl-alcohol dehydrogenase-like predicted oxidoreductase